MPGSLPDSRPNPLERALGALAEGAQRPLAEALSLPPALYHLEEVAALERQEIFHREWVCVGRDDELGENGDYLTREIGGEPVVVLRDSAGALRAFANICRHRLSRLLTGKGRVARIVCPYHAWNYDLEGRLKSAPFMDDDYPREGICLPEHRLESWGGFIYVTLDPEAPPLAPRLAELDRRLANYRLGDFRTLFRREEVWETNWKILVENFTEPYHLSHVHAKTVHHALPTRLAVMGAGGPAFNYFDQYRVPGSSYEYGVPMEPSNKQLTAEELNKHPLCCIFPTHLLAVSPERLFWVSIEPLASDRISIVWGLDTFPGSFPEGSEGEKRLAQLIETFEAINAEDKDIIRDIRRNAPSPHAAQARLTPKEATIWDFTRYLATRLCRSDN